VEGVARQPFFRHSKVQFRRRSYVFVTVGLEINLFLLGVLVAEIPGQLLKMILLRFGVPVADPVAF
jgi:hypothetical protein